MRRFLEELRRRGPSTRADLTRAIGVTPPTSSSIIADLMSAGYLEEVEAAAPARGRPGKFFQLASSSAYVVGATIDIQECRFAPAGLEGVPRYNGDDTVATPRAYDQLLDAILCQVRRIQDRSAGRCLGVGVAVPGLVDERSGTVAFSPNLHFLDGKALGPDLSARLKTEVVLTQEEHALCLCELNQGRAKGLTDFAVMDFSSGVGMGVVCGGRYISGTRGYAGEIGHTTVAADGALCGCGNRGCLETVASDTAFLKAVRNRLGRPVTFEDLDGVDVSQELESALEYLAIGIASVVNLFNPSSVFVHGQLIRWREGLFDDVVHRAKARSLKPSASAVAILLAEGDKLYGATAGLLDELFASVGPTLS